MNENKNGACENCGIHGTLKNVNGQFLCPMCRKKSIRQNNSHTFTFSRRERTIFSIMLGVAAVAVVIYALYYIATGSVLFNIF